MKGTFKLVLLLGLLVSGSALACSPIQEVPFEPEAVPALAEVVPAEPPAVRVHAVQRGRLASKDESSCQELAYITLAVTDMSPSLPFVYSFEVVQGETPDLIFYPDLLFAGSLNGEGERQFSFYWPDLAPSPKPFRIHVKVTPHSRAGTPGPSTVVVVESEV